MAEKEYVERKAVLMLCQDYIDSHEDGSWRWVNAVTDKDIMNIPSADVAPVKHGHWIEEYDCGYITPHCSECGETALTKEETSYDYVYSSYCPRCGAKLC